jgi:hypothetical protein
MMDHYEAHGSPENVVTQALALLSAPSKGVVV